MLCRPFRSLAPWRWLAATYRHLRFAALLLIAAASPRVNHRQNRRRSARIFCLAAWRPLPGYLLATVLLSAILTRIVAVSAAGYGLSHLALEAILRVFVIELLPMASTLFVAMRAVPMAGRDLGGRSPAGLGDALPVALGNALAVVVLAVTGGIVALIVAYLVVHGASLWGLDAYSRLIGQVFDPLLGLALAIKICLFALAVGIVPASVLLDPRRQDAGTREMRLTARLLLILVVIEVSFLLLRRF